MRLVLAEIRWVQVAEMRLVQVAEMKLVLAEIRLVQVAEMKLVLAEIRLVQVAEIRLVLVAEMRLVPCFSGRGEQNRAKGRHLTAMNMLSAFGGFNQRGGCCPLSADSTSGVGAVCQWGEGGGGGCCPLLADSTSEGGGGGGVLSAFG